MASANAILAKDTSINLSWAAVSGANLYRAQVSLKEDFSGTSIGSSSVLVTPAYSFVDGGADNAKRFWRWGYSTDAGVTWSAWSEVGSYWLQSTAAAEILLSSSGWALANPADTTDVYIFPDYPLHSVKPMSIRRAMVRNRAGDMLTEWLISKDEITLSFPAGSYMRHQQMRELIRFETVVKTFFLCAYKTNGVDLVPGIWKVILPQDADFQMLAAGREDFFTSTLIFEEV